MTVPFLRSLAPELLIQTFQHCDQYELSQICQTCSHLRAIAQPLLYRSIDISWHNDVEAQAYPTWKRRLSVQNRQLALLRAFEAHPEYTTIVRRFVWTLHLRPMKCTPAEERSGWQINRLYRLLERLVNVQDLDLSGGPLCYGPPPEFNQCPLFPKARRIRLGGKIHYSLAAAILLGKDEPIQSLALHNLQDPGTKGTVQQVEIKDEDPSLMPALPLCSCAQHEEEWEDDKTPKRVPTGPMRRLLRRLAQERSCANLRDFQYGIDYGYYARQYIYPWIWQDLMDEILLFLRTFRPPVITLEYGTGLPCNSHRPEPGVELVHGLIPLDELLADACGPQKQLQRLEVRGCLMPVTATPSWIKQLRQDTGVELGFDETLRPCWCCPLLSVPQEYFEPEPRDLLEVQGV